MELAALELRNLEAGHTKKQLGALGVAEIAAPGGAGAGTLSVGVGVGRRASGDRVNSSPKLDTSTTLATLVHRAINTLVHTPTSLGQ
jgi:hypothetical protein